MTPLKIFLFFLVFVSSSSLFGRSSQKISETAPVLLYADQVTYAQELGILKAAGNVEIEQEGRVLEADTVTYNENTDMVTASGHVRLRDTDGTVLFVEYIVLKGDLKEGVAREARVLMRDQSRLAAAQWRRLKEGTQTEFDQASYTPCLRCQDHLQDPPLWQIKARQVIKNDDREEVTYLDGQLDFFGVPIAYIPYLKVPLKRQSGFLIPSVGSSTELGAHAGTPYYWVINPEDGSQDLTVTPRITTKQGVILSGIYRKRMLTGKFKTDASINPTGHPSPQSFSTAKGKSVRGHLFLDGAFDVNQHWRLSFQERQVSDKSYLRTRPFFNAPDIALYTSDPVLESRYVAEGFLPRDYLSLEGFHYIGLRDQERFRNTPLVLPVFDYYKSSSGSWGSFMNLNINALSLYRDEGNRTRRIIVDGKGFLPYTNGLGQVYTLFGRLRGDLYDTQVVVAQQQIFKGVTPRFFPQVGLEGRWPFIHSSQGIIVEPIAQVIVGPQGNPTPKIPDEDSQGFEFNEENVFTPDRFPGLDRLDYGSRANYGVQLLARDNPLGTTLFFLGQSYSFVTPSQGLKGTGIGTRLSDVVGRVNLIPSWDWVSLNYRFRLNQKNLRTRYNETEASVGPRSFNLSVAYIFTNPEEMTLSSQKFQQAGFALSSQFAKFWSLQLMTTRSLKNDLKHWETLSQGAGINYQDECLTAGVWFYRNTYRSLGIRPGTAIVFSVTFKNLGGLSYKIQDDAFKTPGLINPFETY